MRVRVEALLLLLSFAGVACGTELQDIGSSGIGTPTTGFDDGNDDDVCADGACCSDVPGDGNRFRCSTSGPSANTDSTGSDSGTDSGTDTETGDSDSGGEEPMCGVSVLLDGGFELGSPHPAWTEETTLPGAPICDDACSSDPDAQPYAGEWFAWFGGVQRPAQMSVSQPFMVSADTAQLRFRFAINASAGTGDDTFAVLVDGNTIFMRTDADETEDDDYIFVPLTLDQWADGQPHDLRFEAEVFGPGLTNFFVDEVELVGCGDPGGADGSGSASETGSLDDTSGDGTGSLGTTDS